MPAREAVAATKDLTVLEKHRERWELEVKKQDQRRQEEFLDEIATWMNSRNDAE